MAVTRRDLGIGDGNAAQEHGLVVRELVHSLKRDIESTGSRMINGQNVDALASLGIRELPASPTAGGVPADWEGTADVREPGKGSERSVAYIRM